PNSILVSSSTNKVTGIVQGLTLNLVAPSDTAIQVTVGQNVDSLVSELTTFIDGYNAALDRIDELTRYDVDTNQKGLLFGENTVLQLRDRLNRELARALPDSYILRQLAGVGITTLDESGNVIGGGRLRLDEQKLRDALSADPAAVQSLFTKVTTVKGADGQDRVSYVGIFASLKNTLRSITSSTSGLLMDQSNRLADQLDLYNERAENMQKLLDRKEANYYAQFQAMEQALARLQSQQSALSQLSGLTSWLSTSSS
ncbi:MAG: flagellar filament capping protein FliD, partial [Planctomycetes bacterium]|nr:flagellar filament capping protein FliD [Planctomycetota bacterium]